MIVVADLFQLKDRIKEVYQIKGTKAIERKGMRVEQSYVDRVNESSMVSGKLFEVDDKSTKEWKSEQEKYVLKVQEEKEKVSLGITKKAEDLINRSSEKAKRNRRTKEQIEADKNKD